MSLLAEALEVKTEEFKSKGYDELLLLAGQELRFTEDYKGASFCFVVHVTKEKDNVKVVIECSRNIFIFHMFFRYSDFVMNPAGEISEIE